MKRSSPLTIVRESLSLVYKWGHQSTLQVRQDYNVTTSIDFTSYPPKVGLKRHDHFYLRF